MRFKKGKMSLAVPETALEALRQLEVFLICDFDSGDWSPEYMVTHIGICWDAIVVAQKTMLKELKEMNEKSTRVEPFKAGFNHALWCVKTWGKHMKAGTSSKRDKK